MLFTLALCSELATSLPSPHFVMEGRDNMEFHVLGVSQICTCEAQHICQSCQGQDYRLRAVNAKLLAGLEGIAAAVTVHPDDSHLGVLDIGAFWEAWPFAREAVEEARK